jgi:gliding motility-associated-like protein
MKMFFFISAFLLCFLPSQARHVAGGELFYEYLGPGNLSGSANSLYRITLRLFRDCATTGPLLEVENVTVGIYSNDNGLLVSSVPLPLFNAISSISLNTSVFPCLVGNVNVCYEIGIYTATVTLPDNFSGYTLSRTGCCRIDRISNLAVATNVGSNYVTKIPGTGVLSTGHNSSPQFFVRDTALVCARKRFTLDFSAFDADGDSLSYSFCEAYTSPSGSNNAPPGRTLSLIPLPYASIYSGIFPLGSEVNINPATGIINGIAPPEGQYVVNVCITEWRGRKPISEHRKDFILKVQNCDIIEAVLPEKIVQCKDSIVHFENQSTSSSITSYRWDFGDGSNNFSTSPTVNYPYADTGMYIARLTVTGPQGCVGSATTRVLVYPGFQPAFSVLGSCVQNPYQFNDLTSTRYGNVNSWRWDLGDEESLADTSRSRNTTYTYPKPSVKELKLIVTNSKGCIDSVFKQLVVADKPKLQLPFKDTLICNIDTLAIPVFNTGNFSWQPNRNILFANTSSPLVFPKDTTRYIVTLNDNGCVNSDTVTVNVLSFIKVQLGNDSLICKTDTIRLQPESHALSYRWSSSTGIAVNNIKFPLVQPMVNTQYYVTANLGKCQDRDTVLIKVAPYPIAQAGPDTTICMGTRIQLRSFVTGSSLNWTPASSLIDPGAGSPVAGPSKTTTYVLRVSDTTGCRKPVTDTVVVTVSPPIPAQAGRDTAVLPNQPLQLQASGGLRYSWYPEYGLSNASIPNPVASLDASIDSIRYRVRVADATGCFAFDDLLVRVYKTGPDIFVPSAFTPNGDGKNELLRPVTLGITQLTYFRVYNRWGQLIFTTSELGKGWDGVFNGAPQAANTYVFEAEGTDYTGKTVYRKGTSVLIR